MGRWFKSTLSWVLIVLLLCKQSSVLDSSSSTKHTNKWAVLVCTSRFWYRTFSQVPVTNFFGSVMETIITGSSYRAFSGKTLRKSKTEIPSDENSRDERKTVKSSDVRRDIIDPNNIIVTQVNCPFTRTWNTILVRIEMMKEADSLVNYGLILILPAVAFSSWLSSGS